MRAATARLPHSAGVFPMPDLIIIVGLLILGMVLTVATFVSLTARIRDLHDEMLAAKLARNDLDWRMLGDPRPGRHRRDGESR
jgi:hypothetical protein